MERVPNTAIDFWKWTGIHRRIVVLRHNRIMEEAMLITGTLLFGAGAGALLTYAHDRNLLRLYGNLVGDLSRMLRQRTQAPGLPAAAARIPDWKPAANLMEKHVS
jgi:hypothetical protein